MVYRMQECKKNKNYDALDNIISEANSIVEKVQAAQEAMEDAKMFTSLVQLVTMHIQETTATEQKFVVSDYSANIARLLSANTSG